jgi:hypothetical protein
MTNVVVGPATLQKVSRTIAGALACGLVCLAAACGGGGGNDAANGVQRQEIRDTQLVRLQLGPVKVAALRANDRLVLSGAGFVENMRITVDTVPVQKLTLVSPNEIAFHIPPNEISDFHAALIEVRRPDGQVVHGSVNLAPTVSVSGSAQVQARAGEALTIGGRNLHLIQAVLFGDSEVSPTLQAADSLTVVVPADAQGGTVRARDRYGFVYPLIGSFSVLPPDGSNAKFETVLIGQSHLRSPNLDFMLIPGKPGLVYAKVSPDVTGVTLHVDYPGGAGSVHPMQAASQLFPTDIAASRAFSVNGAYAYRLAGDEIREGMQLSITAAGRDQLAEYGYHIAPKVAPSTLLHLTLVPLRFLFSMESGKLPDLALLKKRLEAQFPVSKIEISTAMSSPVGARPGAPKVTNTALGELMLGEHRLEPNHYVVGILPGEGEVVEDGVMTGLAKTGGRTAVVWDGGADMIDDIAHEVGHTLGRSHSHEDKTFPFRWSTLGAHWGVDLTDAILRLYDPAQYSDLMSYGDPRWMSSYTYDRIAQYAAFHLKAPAVTQAFAPGRSADLMPVVSFAGTISESRVRVGYTRSPQGSPTVAHAPVGDRYQEGEYSIEIAFEGQVARRYPLNLAAVSGRQSDRDYAFTVTVPDYGRTTQIRIWKGTRVIHEEVPAISR